MGDTGNNGYLSTNGKIEAGSSVEEVALVANDDGQVWERSANDDSGYFTLKNPKSAKFLTQLTGKTLQTCSQLKIFIPKKYTKKITLTENAHSVFRYPNAERYIVP